MTFTNSPKGRHSADVVAAAEKVWGLAKRRPGRPPKKSKDLSSPPEDPFLQGGEVSTETEKELNSIMTARTAIDLEEKPVAPSEIKEGVFPIKCTSFGCATVAHNVEEATKLFTKDRYSRTGFRTQCRSCKARRAAELVPPKRVSMAGSSIHLDFSTLPDAQGEKMAEAIKDIAKKQYRTPAQQIFFILGRYLDSMETSGE